MALDAIARTGSFSKAAEALFKVPSAVSYNIQGLELALGVPVFDRSRRRAVLTDAGRRLLEASRDVLERARKLDQLAGKLRGGWEPQLHVVVDGALPLGPVTGALRRFADPEVPTSLRLDIEFQDGVLDAFNASEADLALTTGFDFNGDEVGYASRALPDIELFLVASPDHPLTQGTFDPERRAGHAELVVRDSSPRFARDPKASFIGSKNVVYLSDFHSKRIALIDAAGYGWIPRHFIAQDLSDGRLVQIEAELNSWTYHPLIVTREGDHLGRGGELFIETLLAGIAT